MLQFLYRALEVYGSLVVVSLTGMLQFLYRALEVYGS
jgi:hypothetical protein